MDLGQFRRSRTGFWAWVAVPILVIGVVSYALNTYCRHVNAAQDSRKVFVEMMPEMTRALVDAKETAEFFRSGRGGATGSLEDLTSWLNEAAQEAGFVVNSLRVKKEEGDVASSEALQEVVINGDGRLRVIMKYLNTLHRPQSMTAVKSARLTVKQHDADPLYGAELVLKCYLLPM